MGTRSKSKAAAGLLSALLLLALAAACLSPWLLPRAGWAAPLCAVLALAALPADIRELRLQRRTRRVRRDPVRR